MSSEAIQAPAKARISTGEVAGMVLRIVVIIFLVEAMVMFALSGWDLNREVLNEALLDATVLSLLSSPLLYWFVAKPFVEVAHTAENALAREVEVKAEKAQQLETVLGEVRALLAQNETLSASLKQANEMAAESNERNLQRIGADLHDGPAQLLAYALLRLNRFAPIIEQHAGPNGATDLGQVRKALSDSLSEVRAISTGLSLPELRSATLSQTIRLAASWHEDHVNRYVPVTIADDLPDDVSDQLKACVYRFVQEALTNTFRHAKAAHVAVAASFGDQLQIAVQDDGVGFSQEPGASTGLGIPGMRSRVQAMGGRLDVFSAPGRGSALVATFPSNVVLAKEQTS